MSITINGSTNTITAASGLTIAGNTAVTGTLSFGEGGGGGFLGVPIDTGYMRIHGSNAINQGAGIILFGTTSAAPNTGRLTAAASTIAQWTATGLAVTGLLDLSAASSGQLKFPATQNASADANTLDDYEEGTFTPTVIGDGTAGTATYTTQTGKYTKVGRQVFVEIVLGWNSGTGTGGLRVSGLPFTVAVGGYSAATIGRINDLALTAGATPQAYFEPNTTQMIFNQVASGGGAYASIAYDAAASSLILSGSYTV